MLPRPQPHQKRPLVIYKKRPLARDPAVLAGLERDVKVPEEARHDEAHLRVGEVLADAVARAGREGAEGRLVVAGVAGLVEGVRVGQEALRLEGVRVGEVARGVVGCPLVHGDVCLRAGG